MDPNHSFQSSMQVWHWKQSISELETQEHLDRSWQMPATCVFLHCSKTLFPMRTQGSSHHSPSGSSSETELRSGSSSGLLAHHSLETSTSMTGFPWVTISLKGSQHEMGWRCLGIPRLWSLSAKLWIPVPLFTRCEFTGTLLHHFWTWVFSVVKWGEIIIIFPKGCCCQDYMYLVYYFLAYSKLSKMLACFLLLLWLLFCQDLS